MLHFVAMQEQHKYIKNAQAFINSLPMSDTRFLYFKQMVNDNEDIILRPRLNKTARLWFDARLKTNPVHLVPAVSKSAHKQYMYVYRNRGIKYSMHLDENQEVTAYERVNPIQSQQEKIKGGQDTPIDTYLGDHYTIGVEKIEDTQRWMLMSHITLYKPKRSDPTQLERKQDKTCNMMMDDAIKNTTQCYHSEDLSPLGVLGNYEKYSFDYEIIPILQLLHKKIAGGLKAGGGAEQVTYKGRRYKVTVGPRGGRSIIVNGKTVRLPRCVHQKGGNDKSRHHVRDGFAEDFVQFIHDYRIAPVFQREPRLHEVIVIDEVESDYILIRYEIDYGDGMDIVRIRCNDFLMPRDVVLAAYDVAKKPVDARTVEDTQVLQSFEETHMKPLVHQQMVVAH